MLLRALPGSPLEKGNNIEDSLVHAKNALKFDLADGKSWFVLGNAYLALFFAKVLGCPCLTSHPSSCHLGHASLHAKWLCRNRHALIYMRNRS